MNESLRLLVFGLCRTDNVLSWSLVLLQRISMFIAHETHGAPTARDHRCVGCYKHFAPLERITKT